MMDADFIAKLEEIVEDAFTSQTTYGVEYDRKTWKPILPPAYQTIGVRTLKAFCDWLGHEKPDPKKWVIHVKDPETVRLISHPQDPTRHREKLGEAKAVVPENRFGQSMSQDRFLIWLQTAFEETEALQELMKIGGNVKSENLHISRDDGVTQEATVRAGVASVETKEIPRRWELSAWRSFIEVEQQTGWYLLRLSQGQHGIELALHPVIDAGWSLKAMQNVKVFLDRELKDKGDTVLA